MIIRWTVLLVDVRSLWNFDTFGKCCLLVVLLISISRLRQRKCKSHYYLLTPGFQEHVTSANTCEDECRFRHIGDALDANFREAASNEREDRT